MKGPDGELSKIGENDVMENEGVFGVFFVIQNMDRSNSGIPCYYGRNLCWESDETKTQSEACPLS
jgi:hypothetical protein